MINLEEWEKGVKMWENIKRQAQIDIEQADLFLEAIHKRMEQLKEENNIKETEMKEDGE